MSEGYFDESVRRKSEVIELQKLLENPQIIKSPEKHRAIVKRVLQQMTQGIDMSLLFMQMIKATHTNDIVQKKMVYLYLCNFAENKPDEAVLVINTLVKDCQDHNPMIRGLALRSIASLRLPSFSDYVQPRILAGLKDNNPYARKTAVLACAKQHKINKDFVRRHNVIDQLYSLIRDSDSHVVVNSLSVLEEILENEGGVALNRQMVVYLLNRFKDFGEWAQCVLLQLLLRYVPDDQDEIYDIMNLLDDRFHHHNSAVVFAVANYFIRLTENISDVREAVYQQLTRPILTILSSAAVELAYAALTHVRLLTARCPSMFAQDYKHFICRFNDPTYVRNTKIDVLTEVAAPATALAIVEELGAYAVDVNMSVAQHAVEAIAILTAKYEHCVEPALRIVMSFLSLESEYLLPAATAVIKDLLRRYPDIAVTVLPALETVFSTISDPDAKASLLWIFGEFGESLESAPYLVERVIDSYAQQAPVVRMQVLQTAMQLFFKRPPEVQDMLGRVLAEATAAELHPDVHDRALFFYRLLKTDVSKASRVILCPKPLPAAGATTTLSPELTDQLFDEFNTLSVVFGVPKETFMPPLPDELLSDSEHEEEFLDDDVSVTRQPKEEDLLDIGSTSFQSFSLDHFPSVDAATFQAKWTVITDSATLDVSFLNQTASTDLSSFLRQHHIHTFASGQLPNGATRYFFFAKQDVALFMIEAILNPEGVLTATIKSEDSALLLPFKEYLQNLLK